MNIIEYKKETINCVCCGCPTIYEFESMCGNKYYFRLRHGYWCLIDETKDIDVCDGKTNELDGICNWDDFVELSRHYIIMRENI